MPKLRLIPTTGNAIDVTRDTFVVGRDPSCDIILTDGSVSRKHARVERRGENWAVVDQASANGTFLDSQRVADTLLAPGQEVRFGAVAFKVELDVQKPPDLSATMTSEPGATMIQASPMPAAPPSRPAPSPPPSSPPPPRPAPPPPVPGKAAVPPPPRPPVSVPAGKKKGKSPLVWVGAGCGCLLLLLLLAGVGYGIYRFVSGRATGSDASSPETSPITIDRGESSPETGTSPAGVAALTVETSSQGKNATGSGTNIQIEVRVRGFQVMAEGSQYRIDLVQDLETLGPDGQKIPSLSAIDFKRLAETKAASPDSASFQTELTIPESYPAGEYTVRFTIRDLLGGTQKTHDVSFSLP